jgi:putative ABC transport system permease protein
MRALQNNNPRESHYARGFGPLGRRPFGDGDTRDFGPNRDAPPTMYFPVSQMPDAMTALNSRVAPLWWAVRTRADPHSAVTAITAALREASGGLPVAQIQTMDEVVARSTSRQQFNMLMMMIFGGSGLLMAAIGVYGVMAYSVQQRTQELGVRIALGAQASQIRSMVIRQGILLSFLGVVIGIGGALWLTRFLASFLFGVQAWDPIAFILTPLILCAVALMAIWIPAGQATRVDPLTALRLE